MGASASNARMRNAVRRKAAPALAIRGRREGVAWSDFPWRTLTAPRVLTTR